MEVKENKMAKEPLKKLFWKMGLPMIVSMVLQALYNVVDSVFVANIKGDGALANEALTYAFPIQILIIALGVGTGVGLNALLSKSLGEKNEEKVNIVAGNGIFLSICIYIIFLVFGLFASEWFISLFSKNSKVIEMGASYLRICTTLSFGSIGFTIYERFLQSTGKTHLSTIAQIVGAVINIVFDYVFIFPLDMGVEGAAIATVLGQVASLILAMGFHYFLNKEINGKLKYIKPKKDIILAIYKIGASASLMQGLLSVMMAGMNAILGASAVASVVLVGSFGIYYKIQQIALFSCFGLSNTIITILSFNYGMKDKKRSEECIKYGILDTLIVTIIITILFEVVARPLSTLFALTSSSTLELVDVCEKAVRIASLSYIFMGVSVAIQGVLQALRYSVAPLFTALLRLVIFVFPVAYLFTKNSDVLNLVWWTFPIAESLTCIISLVILRKVYKEKIVTMEEGKRSDNLIISISREHGTNAKKIGRLIASILSIKFYDKELTKEEAKRRGLGEKYIEGVGEDGYNIYSTLEVNSEAIIAQSEIIKELALNESFVIVGRGADYILKDCNVISIFLYANDEYKIKNIMEMYGDTRKEAIKNMHKSNEARSKYYSLISNKVWGQKDNYDLYLDMELGEEKIVNTILEFLKKH